MAVVVVADDANVIVVVVHVAVDGLPTQGFVFSLTIKPLAAKKTRTRDEHKIVAD